MDLGTGITVAGLSISGAAVCITAIKVRGQSSPDSSHPPASPVCPVHHTIEATCTAMWDSIRTIQEDIKELLKMGRDK